METKGWLNWRWPLAAVLLMVPLIVAISVFSGGIEFPVRGYRFWALAWGMAALVAWLHAIVQTPASLRSIGLFFLLVPVATMVVSFTNSIPVLQDSGSVLRPRSLYSLSIGPARTALIDLGYLGAGALIWFGIDLRKGFAGLGQRLADLRLPGLHRPEGWSAGYGFLWFPVLLLGTWLVDLVLRGAVPALVNGDESRIWANMTPYHALLIAAVAAITEEIQYRLLIMGGIWWMLRRLPWPDGTTRKWAPLVLAVASQAFVFGLAHGGYGTWLHVLQAGLFGIIAGIATVWLGIWAAIILHFLVNVFAIGVHAVPNFGWWEGVLWSLLLINTAISVTWLLRTQVFGKIRQSPGS